MYVCMSGLYCAVDIMLSIIFHSSSFFFYCCLKDFSKSKILLKEGFSFFSFQILKFVT